MNTVSQNYKSPASIGLKIFSIVALVFGVVTLISAGSLLFGSAATQKMAGAYVDFVVWFNFVAGFFYIVTAIGIFLRRKWAYPLSVLIGLATAFIAILFALHLINGAPYELRTVGALALRIVFWVGVAFTLRNSRRSPSK